MKEQKYNNSDQHIIDMLTPKVEVKPSPDLREKILLAAQQAEANTQTQPKHTRSRMSYWLGAIGSAAAVVAIAITLTFNTPAYAARKYFSNALIATTNVKTMVMQLMARTAPNEPIDYFNPSLDFIPATIKVIYNEPMLWSIEKQNGRSLLYKGAAPDGNFVYEWLGGNEGNVGWKKSYDGSVDGDLAIMLDPRELLKIETRIAENRKGATYEILDNGEQVMVRATTKAQGNYSQSDYMLNTSLAEANTVRVYTFAKSTGELTQLRIDFVVDDKPITIIESHSIAYDEPLTANNLSSKDLSQIAFQQMEISASASSPLIGISADDAAKIILKAMNEWDMNILSTALQYYKGDLMKILENKYRGLEVKSIGKSFKSGLYPGRFVKCKVVLADGKKETLILALRNDNEHKVWLLDGGL
ncbi:MAG: hypothetical protein IKY80_04975 [Alistipes sp.]|nr:hypothetical protein [Alistipes sp.]